MKSLTQRDRVIFVTQTDDVNKIKEAKFKLAEMHFGYGKTENRHYWSLPIECRSQAYTVLTSLFEKVQSV